MWLSSYASGDGSVELVWVSNRDRSGGTLPEFVSESDISEWLMEPGNDEKWKGWEVVTLGPASERHFPATNKLARAVVRPFHTSKILRMGGVEYEYVRRDDVPCPWTERNTDFYEVDGRRRHRVENSGVVLSLLFFLNNEDDFERSGLPARESAREAARRGD